MRLSLLLAASLAGAPIPLASQTPAEVAGPIERESVARHIGAIPRDSGGSCETASPDLERTARYVAEQFKRLSLEPGGDGGTWFHRYTVRPRLDVAQAQVVFVSGDKKATATFGSAAYLARGLKSRQHPPTGVTLISGHHSARSLQQAALRDKLVVYVAPADADAGQREVVERLAESGLDVIVLSALDSAEFAMRERIARGQVTASDQALIHIRPDAVRGLAAVLRAGGLDLARARADTIPLVRELPGLEASFTLRFETTAGATAPNVVGTIQGSDPKLKDQFVVLSAHMDHACYPRDSRADSRADGGAVRIGDNTLGIAGLIELANAFSRPGMRPARSLVFLATSGAAAEFQGSRVFAKGLRNRGGTTYNITTGPRADTGSRRRALVSTSGDNGVDEVATPVEGGRTSLDPSGDNTTVEKVTALEVVANVNLDRIDRYAADSITISGLEDVQLPVRPSWIALAHPELHLTVIDGGTAVTPESDHFAFAQVGVPSIYFHGGSRWDAPGTRSADTTGADQATRVAGLVFYVTREVANAPQRVNWTAEGRRRWLAIKDQ